MLKFVLYIILIFSIGSNFGIDTTSVAALLASGGVAIGLALQGALSNFAGGVLILILKPFVVGDYIIEDTNKCEGTVKEIQIFYTKLSTVDNKTIVIPNGALANNSLTNVTAKNERRMDLLIDISYEADLRKAKQLIEQILMEEEAVLKEEEVLVFVDSLGASSVVIGTRSWVKTEEYWPTRWRLLERIKLTMDENGIEIPYQQMTVHLPKEEAKQ
jgi:small conductance mechanosensitive channel